jgi:formylmethanofuran dehydrogenase subunit E
MDQLEKYLIESASRHHQLCPRQVLGVRMGLYAGRLLNLPLPRTDKRLLVISETDGCFPSGIIVTTGCRVSRRTLRIEDYGKVAATFIHIPTKRAFRIAPRLDVRRRAYQYAPHQKQRYYVQLDGYQVMPDDELFMMHKVTLSTPVKNLIGRPGVRVNCESCGEEIINQRQVYQDGQQLCKFCAGESNYFINDQSLRFWPTITSSEVPNVSEVSC